MGNKFLEFVFSDNLALDFDLVVTRFLIYCLFSVFNVWILVCLRVFSFDWLMDVILLVEFIVDIRNLFLIVFYVILFYFFLNLLIYIYKDSYNSSS